MLALYTKLYFSPPFSVVSFFFLFLIYLFIYFWLYWVFLAARRLSSYGESGLLFVAVHGLLIAVASLVEEHRL